MDAPPTVSAVICTRNRPNTIRQAVESVLANGYPCFDLTVIDQSVTDDTARQVRAIAAEDGRLRYLQLRQTGAARARNAGIRASGGEILAFTDDDCVVPRDWIERIVTAFSRDQEADLVYGQVLAGQVEGERHIIPALSFDRPARFSRRQGFRVFGMSANFGARRRLFERIGCFDESLGAGTSLPGGEDFDLTYRAYRSGAAILVRPEIHVVHYGARSPKQWATLANLYGRGNGAFYAKHARCRDLFMCCLLLKDVGMAGGKASAKRLLGRPTMEFAYVRGFLAGFRESLHIPVNRETRLYQS